MVSGAPSGPVYTSSAHVQWERWLIPVPSGWDKRLTIVHGWDTLPDVISILLVVTSPTVLHGITSMGITLVLIVVTSSTLLQNDSVLKLVLKISIKLLKLPEV